MKKFLFWSIFLPMQIMSIFLGVAVFDGLRSVTDHTWHGVLRYTPGWATPSALGVAVLVWAICAMAGAVLAYVVSEPDGP